MFPRKLKKLQRHRQRQDVSKERSKAGSERQRDKNYMEREEFMSRMTQRSALWYEQLTALMITERGPDYAITSSSQSSVSCWIRLRKTNHIKLKVWLCSFRSFKWAFCSHETKAGMKTLETNQTIKQCPDYTVSQPSAGLNCLTSLPGWAKKLNRFQSKGFSVKRAAAWCFWCCFAASRSWIWILSAETPASSSRKHDC